MICGADPNPKIIEIPRIIFSIGNFSLMRMKKARVCYLCYSFIKKAYEGD